MEAWRPALQDHDGEDTANVDKEIKSEDKE